MLQAMVRKTASIVPPEFKYFQTIQATKGNEQRHINHVQKMASLRDWSAMIYYKYCYSGSQDGLWLFLKVD